MVLDEAAHIAPLPELDGLAATCASHGIQLVTVWQDLAQVRARYGCEGARRCSTTTGPSSSCPGSPTPTRSSTPAALIGDEEITMPSVTRDPTGRPIQPPRRRGPRRLLPPEELRCLRRGEAVSWSTAPCRRRGSICGRGGLPAAILAADLPDGADDLVHAR